MKRKRHRWCLTICLDCGLHRSTAKAKKSGKIFTEYRQHIVLNRIKGTALYTGKVGACGDPLPPGEYRFFPTEVRAP